MIVLKLPFAMKIIKINLWNQGSIPTNESLLLLTLPTLPQTVQDYIVCFNKLGRPHD
jgi:hypothetical protein